VDFDSVNIGHGRSESPPPSPLNMCRLRLYSDESCAKLFEQ